mmetsp:Transcript_490/g.761  ORF Transcript_490/g.761 Transcript_490/m.761 type:complete len:508 (-) Transcript_490:128-1651(-)
MRCHHPQPRSQLSPKVLLFLFVLSLSKNSSTATATTAEIPTTIRIGNRQIPIFSSTSSLPVDSHNRLSSHWYLAPRICVAMAIEAAESVEWHEDLMPLGIASDELAEQLFGLTSYCPSMACLEKGTLQPMVTDWNKIYDKSESSTSTASKWFENKCTMMEVGWVSYMPQESLALESVYPNNVTVLVDTLKQREQNTVWRNAKLGHRFELRDTNENGEGVIATYRVEHNSFFVIGDSRTFLPTPLSPENISNRVEQTLQTEWNRSRNIHRTFSKTGFLKFRLPNHIFASMQAFYHNNRHESNFYREEWHPDSVHINWWEAEASMVVMPWKLKQYWQRELLPFVEEIASVGGAAELEDTAIYGMRKYTKGSRLLMHVDREATHAASLIVNVYQQDVLEPWNLEILDYDDRLHRVQMEPGDAVYYESARCLHSRTTPFRGGTYVNLFTHYRPRGDPEWYQEYVGPELERVVNSTVISEETATDEFMAGGDALFEYWKRTGREDRKGEDEL